MNEMSRTILKISGEVKAPQEFTYQDLLDLAAEYQVPDFKTVVPNRPGVAVKLQAVLDAAKVRDTAKFLGLHSSHDNFHASIPLAEVRERGYVIYGFDDSPLPQAKGGPVRFFIPDHAQCNTEDIDECANVKFVDHMEFTSTRGFDNRPTDEEEHAKLHEHE